MFVSTMKRKIILSICVTLLILLAFSGCVETNNDADNNDTDPNGNEIDLTGTATYSGIWTGSSVDMGDIQGTWQYTVNFDQGTVSGWFEGDAAGDISGTVSEGIIQAQGEAALGTVEWSGSFSSDGEEVSGSWEFLMGYGSGTWSGTRDETTNDNDNSENGSEEDNVEEANSL